ncbi:MAG TPA: ABC transporter ATP-binding protein, partial [Pseudonocardiaceae bacterium]
LRDNKIGVRMVDDGLLVDLAGTSAPVVVETLVRADVPVHEVRRQRADLEELFARLTESAPDDNAEQEGVR